MLYLEKLLPIFWGLSKVHRFYQNLYRTLKNYYKHFWIAWSYANFLVEHFRQSLTLVVKGQTIKSGTSKRLAWKNQIFMIWMFCEISNEYKGQRKFTVMLLLWISWLVRRLLEFKTIILASEVKVDLRGQRLFYKKRLRVWP